MKIDPQQRRDFSQRDLQERTWLRAAHVAGEEGRRWAEQFQASPFSAALEGMGAALGHMRAGDIEAGKAELERCEQVLDATPVTPGSELTPSHAKVFERFLCGVIAYDRFREKDYDGAMEALARGERAALAALAEHRFLLTMANIFCEFCVQRARVSRERRDWPALEHYLETAKKMVISRRPLCVLEDGQEIFVLTIAKHFAQFELSQRDRDMIAEFHDEDFLTRRFDKFIYRMPIPRDFIVPFH